MTSETTLEGVAVLVFALLAALMIAGGPETIDAILSRLCSWRKARP